MSVLNQSAVPGVAPAAPQSSEPAAIPSLSPLTRDFLTWVASKPRCYAETMEAWRTNCPRYTIWEDALGDGLIDVARGSGVRMGRAPVTLTPRGRASLLALTQPSPNSGGGSI